MIHVTRLRNGQPRVAWICDGCAVDSGGVFPANHVATFHEGECGVCKQRKVVTEPRDYAWLGCPGGDCG